VPSPAIAAKANAAMAQRLKRMEDITVRLKFQEFTDHLECEPKRRHQDR
jgi:hypothetical protein